MITKQQLAEKFMYADGSHLGCEYCSLPDNIHTDECPYTLAYQVLEHKNSVDLIDKERQHQLELGCTPESDQKYSEYELLAAASVYMFYDLDASVVQFWPWDRNVLKPEDRIKNLTKAAALIAAEIDRLEAMNAQVHR